MRPPFPFESLPPGESAFVALALSLLLVALLLAWRLRRHAEDVRSARHLVESSTRAAHGARAEAATARLELSLAKTEAAAAAAELEKRCHELEREVASLRTEADALRVAGGLAREELRKRDAFLAMIAHELRTPLNAIVGWAHVLRAGTADAATRSRGLDAILRNAEQQSRLISDLLDLSRGSAGTLRLDIQSVELTTVFRSALDTVRPIAEEKGVRLRSSVDAEAGPLRGDPHRLQQVVWNLLVNAVRFTPAGGEVRVTAERLGDDIELRVSDTGAGIPDDFLPHVFDPFWQGPAGSPRLEGGLGLGLAIVRQLVEAHRGRASVCNNKPEPGSTFVVRIPMHGEPATPAGADEEVALDANRLPSLEGTRVVMLEDEPAQRDIVASVLQERGASVSSVSTSAEALELVKSSHPDLLICDLERAGEDGYVLMRRVRELSAHEGGAVAAVALSAQATAEERVDALLAGYQGHVTKPVQPAELVAIAATLIDRAHHPAAAG